MPAVEFLEVDIVFLLLQAGDYALRTTRRRQDHVLRSMRDEHLWLSLARRRAHEARREGDHMREQIPVRQTK